MNEHVERVLKERLTQAVEYATNMVSAAKWTEAQAKAYVDDIRIQAAKEVVGVQPVSGVTPKDPRKADPINKPPLTLYADGLRRDGMNDKQILQLVQEAAAVGETAIQAEVEKERALQQADADRLAERKRNATPEGLREFAQAERERKEVEASQLVDAETILESKGFSADDVASLTPAERLRFSGVDPEAAGPDRGSHMPPSRFIEGS
jgi:hypothetical protein